jgi:hypothetical protein
MAGDRFIQGSGPQQPHTSEANLVDAEPVIGGPDFIPTYNNRRLTGRGVAIAGGALVGAVGLGAAIGLAASGGDGGNNDGGLFRVVPGADTPEAKAGNSQVAGATAEATKAVNTPVIDSGTVIGKGGNEATITVPTKIPGVTATFTVAPTNTEAPRPTNTPVPPTATPKAIETVVTTKSIDEVGAAVKAAIAKSSMASSLSDLSANVDFAVGNYKDYQKDSSKAKVAINGIGGVLAPFGQKVACAAPVNDPATDAWIGLSDYLKKVALDAEQKGLIPDASSWWNFYTKDIVINCANSKVQAAASAKIK